MRHLGMTPRLIELGEKEQNGDVEAANGAIKRRLDQALLVRGSRDFESVDAWQAFIDETLRKANANRGRRVAEGRSRPAELEMALGRRRTRGGGSRRAAERLWPARPTARRAVARACAVGSIERPGGSAGVITIYKCQLT
jgi:hypothetical protein